MMRVVRFIARSLVLALLVAPGCAHYAPPAAEAPVRIALAPVVNEAGPPQLIAPLARNLREALAHAPRWELVEPDRADALLRVTVLPLRREALSRDPADTGRPLSFYETLVLAVEWDSALPPPWGDAAVIRIEADTLLYSQPSQVTSEAMALPALAQDLARKVLERLDWPAAPDRP